MNKILTLLLALISYAVFSQNTKLKTYYEKSDFKETPDYNKTVEYCKLLDSASNQIYYTSFGKSGTGLDLPMLIVDKEGLKNVSEIRKKGRMVLLIQACIHPGEPDGKDAGFMLLRDITSDNKYQSLINNVSILFMPIVNVDGHERFGPYNRINQDGPVNAGWRTNAKNLNLNRDYLKADSPEIKAWLKVYSEWLPEFFIDCHVTDGADYQYVITYDIEIYGNMSKELTDWQKDVYLKYMNSEMKSIGYPLINYVAFRNWHDPRSGLRCWAAPPLLSEGYTAVQNRPGLLIETHMLKDYKTRVTATYELLKKSIEFLNKEYKSLQEIEKNEDFYTASKDFRKKLFPLNYSPTNDSTMIDFLGFEYTAEKSDLTGGLWFKYDRNKPSTFKIPFFNILKPESFVSLPEAYIIPPEWTDVIDRIKNHGIESKILQANTEIKVKTYKFKNVKFRDYSYEGRQIATFDVDSIEKVVNYPKGSVIINMNNRNAKIIAHILEPTGPDSYVHWGFFNAIFEQKEYVESYVMEKMAREMIAKDPKLKDELNKLLSENKEYVNNQEAILNWFFSKTPYFDTKLNLYPVGKIYDNDVLNSLELKSN